MTARPDAARPGAARSAAAPPGTPDPRRWWALGALVVCVLVLGFDLTILNVALPAMASQLGADTGEQQWIADSYIVVFAALLLPAGLLGDRFGRRRMLTAGLVVFLAGSVAGTFAGSPEQLVAARAGMGVGAALVMPLALSVLPSLFGDEERSKAVGAIAAGSAAGLPLGPLVGGWLLDHYWWGSVFLVNVPLAAFGILACLLLLPESRDPAAPAVGAVSTLLSAGGLGALVFGIIEGPGRGWTDPLVLLALSGSAAMLAGLVLHERRSERPLLDLGLLRRPAFLWNTLTTSLTTLVIAGLLFLLPQYLQAVLGYGAFDTGVRLMPMMGGLLVAARCAAPLVRRLGARTVVSAGLVVLAAAAFLGAATGPGDGYGWAALWLTVAGTGFGFAVVPAMDGALAALPADRSGTGSGLLQTLRQVGGAVGVALLGSLLAGAFTGRLDTSGLPGPAADAARESVVAAHLVATRLDAPGLAASADAAFVHGMSLALAVCGVAALVTAVFTALRLPGRRHRDA
ncbi:DHA2 family efflux MFS transporter permease subunit [Streptomyces sp. Ru87]|uniref:DHA2 family efflux MFS transporter permease subunit n=1 Tax=Streptomyces sp. Ru87 TaxID=2044307 RepID=UPI000BFA2544|nr:DHA2 family efflux MFS transporter permease subunit [Streptomyces sp. Ru87]PGH48490.1 MFS transporter [Streptomyces sp. Ru87]